MYWQKLNKGHDNYHDNQENMHITPNLVQTTEISIRFGIIRLLIIIIFNEVLHGKKKLLRDCIDDFIQYLDKMCGHLVVLYIIAKPPYNSLALNVMAELSKDHL